MDNKKVCFICCYKDEDQYFNLAESVSKLKLPKGYKSEIFSVTEVDNIFEAYNAVMKHSDAKYKVYVRENVRFLEEDILVKTIEIFKKYSNLGMLGIAGGKVVPQSGEWQEANYKYGMYYEDDSLKLFENVTDEYEYVKLIDGSFMMTQYDLNWREDIFNGWGLYASSHSLEFINAGYEVGVIKQDKAFCKIGKNSLDSNKDKYTNNLNVFVNTYLDLNTVKFYRFGQGIGAAPGFMAHGAEGISIGNNVFFNTNCYVGLMLNNFSGQPRIIIGDGCQLQRNLILGAANKVILKNSVLIGPNVFIADCGHEYKNIGVPIMNQGVSSVTNTLCIESDCWIGANAVIVGNLTIGRGSVIGANSLVNRDVPDYCVAVGNPAKVIKAYDSRKKDWVKVVDKAHLEDILKNRKKV